MLPLWQAEFGIGYAALGLLRTCFSGTMAGFQIPSALLSERLGMPLVLAVGTALSGIGYLIAGASIGFWTLVIALLIGGLGLQHAASAGLGAGRPRLRRVALDEGARHLQFRRRHRQDVGAGGGLADAGAAAVAAGARDHGPGRPCGRGGDLLAGAAASGRGHAAASAEKKAATRGGRGSRFGFPVLLSIGMIDSATRMGFLIFLPFVLIAKGASLPTVGLALTLVFAGGAAGKLVCAFIGARIGVIATVCLTEGLTTAGIFALLPLPLEAALVVLPVIGIMLNGTSSVLYGSVPELVEPDKRTRMFGIFYTGTIGSGAVAPALYGLVGDALGVPTALMVVAGVCLLTLPLALVLRPMLPAASR